MKKTAVPETRRAIRIPKLHLPNTSANLAKFAECLKPVRGYAGASGRRPLATRLPETADAADCRPETRASACLGPLASGASALRKAAAEGAGLRHLRRWPLSL